MYFSPMRAAWPAQVILLDLIILTLLGKIGMATIIIKNGVILISTVISPSPDWLLVFSVMR
jgi:hypothetical protein